MGGGNGGGGVGGHTLCHHCHKCGVSCEKRVWRLGKRVCAVANHECIFYSCTPVCTCSSARIADALHIGIDRVMGI